MDDLITDCEEHGLLHTPAVMVHGGAGEFRTVTSTADVALLEAEMSAALDAAWEVLCAGGAALDASVAAVASLEASGRFNAGRGAVATSAGTVETDAAVMDGATGTVGAICAATWPESPVRAARAVAELNGPTKGPILLAGPGADRFCAAAGLPRRDPALLTGEGLAPMSDGGTVGAVTLDQAGHVAAATSTGGRLGKLPGRVGDSPVVGAGTWANDAGIAVSGTGEGESFLVAGFAHLVEWGFALGRPLEGALFDALASVRARGGHGGAIVLAPDGRYAAAFNTVAMARGWRDRSGSTVRLGRPVGGMAGASS